MTDDEDISTFERAYVAERELLISHISDWARSFDRWVLTLAGGALGFSAALPKWLGASGLTVLWPLVLAWVLLAASLMSACISAKLSQRAGQLFLQDLDESAQESFSAELFTKSRKRQQDRRITKWIDRLDYASLGGLWLGSLFICLFVLLAS